MARDLYVHGAQRGLGPTGGVYRPRLASAILDPKCQVRNVKTLSFFARP